MQVIAGMWKLLVSNMPQIGAQKASIRPVKSGTSLLLQINELSRIHLA